MTCPPGMRECPATCGHRRIVTDYREERQRVEQVADDASLGYRTEYTEWVQAHPLITFKQWLIQSRRIG